MGTRESGAYAEFARELAIAAGAAILPHFRVALDVADKGASGEPYDPVTVADRAAEALIRERIARAYPDHGIRGEEHGWQKGTSNYTWVIDPIDGTRSFILGQLHWATLIALNDGDARRGGRRAPAFRRRDVRGHGGRRGVVAARLRAATARDAPLHVAFRRGARRHRSRHVPDRAGARRLRSRRRPKCACAAGAATATAIACWRWG